MTAWPVVWTQKVLEKENETLVQKRGWREIGGNPIRCGNRSWGSADGAATGQVVTALQGSVGFTKEDLESNFPHLNWRTATGVILL